MIVLASSQPERPVSFCEKGLILDLLSCVTEDCSPLDEAFCERPKSGKHFIIQIAAARVASYRLVIATYKEE